MIKQKPCKAIQEEFDAFYRRVECIWWNKSAIIIQAVIVVSFFSEFLWLTKNIRVIWPWTCFEKIVNDFNINLPLAHSRLPRSLYPRIIFSLNHRSSITYVGLTRTVIRYIAYNKSAHHNNKILSNGDYKFHFILLIYVKSRWNIINDF